MIFSQSSLLAPPPVATILSGGSEGLSAAISSVFALKVSYTLLFDNQPVQVVVPGTTPADDGVFTFDKYDHRLAASLVMNL